MPDAPKLAVLFVAVAPPSALKGTGRPFAKVDGREVFMRTIEVYASRDQVEQRVLCVGIDDLQTIQSKYGAHLGFQGVSVTAGGPDWFGVVARGLEKLKPEIQAVLIHDASCPAVPYHLLDALEAALSKTGAAAPQLALAGHIAKISGNTLDATVDTTSPLQQIQSPQIFARAILAEAYAKRDGLAGQKPADDAALVRLAGAQVTMVPGSAYNVRIASDELQKLAGDYLKHLPKARKTGPITPFDEAQW